MPSIYRRGGGGGGVRGIPMGAKGFQHGATVLRTTGNAVNSGMCYQEGFMLFIMNITLRF